jgi:hypothetical protein|tara:strand:- start:362 stop:640 length:279 start_codon:yes stop_codon:yes gene_type:complete
MASMMELPQEELERMQFFEQARVRAEQDHKANPSDAQVRVGFRDPGREPYTTNTGDYPWLPTKHTPRTATTPATDRSVKRARITEALFENSF